MSVTGFYEERKKQHQIAADLTAFREALQDLVVTPGRMISDFLELAEKLEKDTHLHRELINPSAQVAVNAVEGHPQIKTATGWGISKVIRDHILIQPRGKEWVGVQLRKDVEAFLRGKGQRMISKNQYYKLITELVSAGYLVKRGTTGDSVWARTEKEM